MKNIAMILLVLGILVCAGTASAFSDADSPSFVCTGYQNQYVRITLPVEFVPSNYESNGTVVKVKFSTGMSGKDTDVAFLDGQHLSAILTFEGYCQDVNGTGYLNTHWAYDSGLNGAAYSLNFGSILRTSRL